MQEFHQARQISIINMTRGSFINDVMLILTFYDPPPPSVTFHHKNSNPPKNKNLGGTLKVAKSEKRLC